jgi:signal transduction histidine kinase
MVAVGAGHLEQILDNLLANAIEALDEGGRVTVTASASEAGIQLVVADDGPGMSPDERARAFMRFFSASPNGTGLGLAIVHRLVTSNGGTARLSETPGGGLTVTLEFPGALSASEALPGRRSSGQRAPRQEDVRAGRLGS